MKAGGVTFTPVGISVQWHEGVRLSRAAGGRVKCATSVDGLFYYSLKNPEMREREFYY